VQEELGEDGCVDQGVWHLGEFVRLEGEEVEGAGGSERLARQGGEAVVVEAQLGQPAAGGEEGGELLAKRRRR
jgi:hypothetical protein